MEKGLKDEEHQFRNQSVDKSPQGKWQVSKVH